MKYKHFNHIDELIITKKGRKIIKMINKILKFAKKDPNGYWIRTPDWECKLAKKIHENYHKGE